MTEPLTFVAMVALPLEIASPVPRITIGTIGFLASKASLNAPFLNSPNDPVRLLVPSGKKSTETFFSSHFCAS